MALGTAGAGSQYPVSGYIGSAYFQFSDKLRCVADVDFKEEDRILGRDVIVDPFLQFLKPIFCQVSGLAAVCDDTDLVIRHIVYEAAWHLSRERSSECEFLSYALPARQMKLTRCRV